MGDINLRTVVRVEEVRLYSLLRGEALGTPGSLHG